MINLRSIRPLDEETILNSVKKTNRALLVEENKPFCGVDAQIAYMIQDKAFDYLDAPVINCTGKDVPMPYAANLEKLALVTTADVIDAVHKVTYR